MKVIARLCNAEEPVDGFQSLVCLGIVIVDPKGRRVGDENIERASRVEAVPPQPERHTKRSEVRFCLGVLVGPSGVVTDGSAKAADQKFLIPDQLQIQVGAAFRVGEGVFRVVVWVVIAWHVKQRNIEHGQQVFKVRVRQVSAPQDQLDLTKVTARTKTIQAVHHLIADGKYLHSGGIVPQNNVPGKGI